MERDFNQGREKVAPTVLTRPRLSGLFGLSRLSPDRPKRRATMGQTKIPSHGCRSVRDGRGDGLGWCLNHGVPMRDLLQTVVDGPCGASSDRPEGACLVEPCPPQPHGGTRGLPAMGNRVIGEPLSRRQVDPRPEYNSPGTGLRSHPCLHRLRLCSRHRQRVGWFPPAPDDTRPTRYQKI